MPECGCSERDKRQMSFVEIVLLSISLCFDTLAVSVVGGACISDIGAWKRVKIILSFALFQAGFTFVGWILGETVNWYIDSFDHWIAFGLLAYIGGKMVFDAFRKGNGAEKLDLLNTRTLILSSVATSIDALAVGISLAMIQMGTGRVLLTVALTGLFTALAAAVGLGGGERLSRILGRKCNIIGGVILVAIGVKILLEHLL